ncbi:MAG: hypothetical protein KBD66_01710 [Candidatus Doudnabacteria bacterium]|nr:hypothetical protein [Candidatus Doudnabacteria bacterium]
MPKLSGFLPVLKSLKELKMPSSEDMAKAARAAKEFDDTVNLTLQDELFFERCIAKLKELGAAESKPWDEWIEGLMQNSLTEKERGLLRRLTFTGAPDIEVGVIPLVSIVSKGPDNARMLNRFHAMELKLTQAETNPKEALVKAKNGAQELYGHLYPKLAEMWSNFTIPSVPFQSPLTKLDEVLTAPRGAEPNWLEQIKQAAEAEKNKYQNRKG